MSSLRSYFANEAEQRRALAALGDWFQACELDLYDASVYAFDPSTSKEEALRSFGHIYHDLASRHWNVFRPSSPAECWEPERIFETVSSKFSAYSWRGPISLLTFWKPATASHLQSCLIEMRGIKPKKKGYPIMTASKFLHFYNPALFPIYDTEVMWKKVLDGAFRSDFGDFCNGQKLPYDKFRTEDSVDFLPAYMLWANSLLSAAHRGFMQVFVDWLAAQPGTDLGKRRFDPATLYARAFEYTATGAAFAESPQSQ